MTSSTGFMITPQQDTLITLKRKNLSNAIIGGPVSAPTFANMLKVVPYASK
jgi:hypothetical protein